MESNDPRSTSEDNAFDMNVQWSNMLVLDDEESMLTQEEELQRELKDLDTNIDKSPKLDLARAKKQAALKHLSATRQARLQLSTPEPLPVPHAAPLGSGLKGLEFDPFEADNKGLVDFMRWIAEALGTL